MSHSPRDRVIGWILVAIQAGLIGGIVLVPRDAAFDGGASIDWLSWLLIGVAGLLGVWALRHLGSGLTPLPLPNGSVDLITSGPYRWMRHPIYTAVMVGMSGIALRTRSWVPLALAAALVVFLGLKSRWEERHLEAGFPGYSDYAETTARFVPIRRPKRD